MAFDVTTTPAEDDATKLTDYVRLRDAARYLAPATAGVTLASGGSLDAFVTDDSVMVPVPFSGGTSGVEIDGAYLGYASVWLEVVVRRYPSATSDALATIDVWEATTGAAVASSEINEIITSSASQHRKSTAFTLASVVRRYYVRMRTNVTYGSIPVACEWRIVAKGV